jgi:Fe-S cluster assembly protein SufD
VSAVLLEEFGAADPREESWRYSRNALRALAQNDFATAAADVRPGAKLLARIDWQPTRGRRLVFVNGAYASELSDISALEGVAVERTGRRAALTFSQAGAIAHSVHIGVPGTGATRWDADAQIRVVAREVTLIQQFVAGPGADLLGAAQVTIDIADEAGADIVRLCDLPDNASLVRREVLHVGRDATCRTTEALFGGRLQRHDIAVALGERARLSQRGVFALRGRQHVDVRLDIRHTARDTASDVVWRGVADQRARGILHGAITVERGADGSDARLETKNLLLSPHAEIDAQPVLEIYADEVKASHGATVGQLDDRALFYLRSRGLPAALARSLLIAGFCREVFAGVADADLRVRLEQALDERLPQAEGDRS